MKLVALVLLSPLAFAQKPLFEVEPRPGVWDELGVDYRLRWQLPFARPGHETTDLLPSMAELVEFRDEAPQDSRLASFATLVDAVRQAGSEGPQLLEQLLAQDGGVTRRVRPFVRELLDDRGLHAAEWDSEDSTPDDGIAELATVQLPGFKSSPWNQVGGSDDLFSAAILLFADEQAWFDAQHDFAAFLKRPDANFEAIGPRPGTYLLGKDPKGRPFATATMWFKSDLPFPFTNFDTSIHLLHHLDDTGRIVTDFYGRSKDCHWMAGQDVHFPLLREDGSLVAILIVRRYGFDIKGVPEKEKQRREDLRSSIGNLKRDAERLFRASGRPLTLEAGVLPRFRVLGPPK